MLQNPQENVCDGVLFFNKSACEIELFYNFTKKGSITGVPQWILQNFSD